MDLFDLTGKTALITGSNRGIGLALAAALQKAGASVILNGRDADRVAMAATGLRRANNTVHELVFDVTDHAACRVAIDGFETDHAPIDILINNAGMQQRGALEDFRSEDFEVLMRTNVSSVFNVGQAVARHMIGRSTGKIINIASIQSALARPSITPYTTSKGAVAALTKGMATDWGPKGLQINAIAPGYFKTKLNQALIDDPEFSNWISKRTPAGRWGNVQELGGAAIFLASEASSYINGITLFVDGGMSACL